MGSEMCIRDSPYGGAFKVSKNLSFNYPERILNTPISEQSIIGIGTGLALNGYIPIVEIMFGDFMSLCFDQLINHACKFQYMYNDQVRVPLVIRTPMGGYRGYGPTHSQSLEKYFLGIPNLKILALNIRVSPDKIFNTLFENISCIADNQWNDSRDSPYLLPFSHILSCLDTS